MSDLNAWKHDWKTHVAEIEGYEARCGICPRAPMSVGELKSLLAGVSDDTPFLVSHQPRYQYVGIQDPIAGLMDIGRDSGCIQAFLVE